MRKTEIKWMLATMALVYGGIGLMFLDWVVRGY